MKRTMMRMLAMLIVLMLAMPGYVSADDLTDADANPPELSDDLLILDDEDGGDDIPGDLLPDGDFILDGDLTLEGDLLLDGDLSLTQNGAAQAPAAQGFDAVREIDGVRFRVTAVPGALPEGAELRVAAVEDPDGAVARVCADALEAEGELVHRLYRIEAVDGDGKALAPDGGAAFPAATVAGLNPGAAVRVVMYDEAIAAAGAVEAVYNAESDTVAFEWRGPAVYDVVSEAKKEDVDSSDEQQPGDGQQPQKPSPDGEGGPRSGSDEVPAGQQPTDGEETSSVSPDGEPASPEGKPLGTTSDDGEQPSGDTEPSEQPSDDPDPEAFPSGEGGASQGDATDEVSSSDSGDEEDDQQPSEQEQPQKPSPGGAAEGLAERPGGASAPDEVSLDGQSADDGDTINDTDNTDDINDTDTTNDTDNEADGDTSDASLGLQPLSPDGEPASQGSADPSSLETAHSAVSDPLGPPQGEAIEGGGNPTPSSDEEISLPDGEATADAAATGDAANDEATGAAAAGEDEILLFDEEEAGESAEATGAAAEANDFAALQAKIDAAADGGTIVLDRDYKAVDGDDRLEVTSGKAVTIDLNGHTVDADQKTDHVFYIEYENSALTLKGDGAVRGAKMSGVFVGYSGAFTLTGGATITGNGAIQGGGVYVSQSTFNMSGGGITGNNSSSHGGGVYVHKGTFNLSGGEITDNSNGINSNGGGLFVFSSTFNMSGGEITGNTSYTGGGVYLHDSTFNLSGGEITGNNTSYIGGGVHLHSSTLNLSGDPVVRDNTASGKANNVYTDSAIIINDALGSQCDVGITWTGAAFTSGFSAEMGTTVEPSGYFFSDKTDFKVVWDSDKKEAKLVSVESGVTYRRYDVDKSHFVTDITNSFDVINTTLTEWSSGWYVANSEATISNRLTVTNDVSLILCDGATLTVPKGITVAEGSSLTIYGQAGGTGKLFAGTNCDLYNAGIGGGGFQGAGGTVIVHGGAVTANGGQHGAGIGGGFQGAGGTVNIYGGTVTVNGGQGGAGIGGGYGGAGGTVNISGGRVTATGSEDGAGIGGGGGWNGANGDITISGGTVTANGGDYGAGIGSGFNSGAANGKITISGGTVTATGGQFGADIGTGYNSSAAPGAVTITGGKVTATSEDGAGIGRGDIFDATPQPGTVTLGWTKAGDYIQASSLDGTVSLTQDFLARKTDRKGAVIRETGTNAALSEEMQGALNNVTLVPLTEQTYKITAGLNPAVSGKNPSITVDGVPVTEAVYGTTITLTAPKTGSPEAFQYGLSSVRVADTGYPEHFSVIDTAKGTYSFDMPMTDVRATFTMWAKLQELINAAASKQGGDTIALDWDVTALPPEDGDCLSVPQGNPVTIDLKGHTIDRALAEKNTPVAIGGCVIDIGGSLTLKDSAGGGKLTGGYQNYGGAIYATGDFTLAGGTITGNRAVYECGGVYSWGTFNMTGGEISNNVAEKGNAGGVLVQRGVFTMSGGLVRYNKAEQGNGGGVFVNVEGNQSQVAFNLQSGGEICGNRARNGGGVFVHSGGFVMKDKGYVFDNVATQNGGGVYVSNDDGAAPVTFAMSDGTTLYHNSASGNGGGLYLHDVPFTISGSATIELNSASGNGGGAYLDKGTFTMSDSTAIRNNAASGDGGGVYLNDGNFTLSGGTVGAPSWTSPNSAANGGGLYLNDGIFTMTGGGIIGNKASQKGAGVYNNNASFTLSGPSAINDNVVDNADSNLWLESGGIIIGGAMTGKIPIGIAMPVPSKNGFTTRWSEFMKDANPDPYFKCEVRDCYIGYTENKKELMVVDPRCQVKIADGIANGSVTGPDKAVPGKTVTLTVTPAAGYGLAADGLSVTWTDDQNAMQSAKLTRGTGDAANTWSFTMPAYDVKVSAVFAYLREISVAPVTGGTCTVDKEEAVAGETVTINVTKTEEKADLMRVEYVDGDSGNHHTLQPDSPGVYTFQMPDNDVTVAAIIGPWLEHDGLMLHPWGRDYTPGDANRYIYEDFTADGWTVMSDAHLFLNGHALTGDCDGPLIQIQYGTLTICDVDGNSGSITNKGQFGSAIYTQGPQSSLVLNGGTIKGCRSNSIAAAGVGVLAGSFTMNGGVITDNALTKRGGGVCVNCCATFTMNGGTITGNGSDYCGGGVFVYGGNSSARNAGGALRFGDGDDGGTFILNGGTITGNGANSFGGGVYIMQGAHFKISGAPVITGNTAQSAANNVCLDQGAVIEVTGKLDGAAQIGVNTEAKPGTDGAVTLTKGLKGNGDVAAFTSDNTAYAVRWSDDGTEAVLDVCSDPAPTAASDYTTLAMLKTSGKTKLVLSWMKVKGAAGYDVFYSKCEGKDNYRLWKSIKNPKTLSCRITGLKRSTAYKAYVRAWRKVDGKKRYIGKASPTVHAITGGCTSKATNAKKVKAKPAKLTLARGRSRKITATVTGEKARRKLLNHVSALRYYSSDHTVAKVNGKGKITAVGKGTCTIYVIANNGVRASVKVKVK